MRALILAAGRGERMRPLTDTVPKPLLMAGGRRLIEWQIAALVRAGIADIVINTAHLPAEFERLLGDGQAHGASIRYSREGARSEDALETLGGIVHALPLLGDASFAVVSGDIVSDFDFTPLHAVSAAIDRGDALAHLVLVDNPAFHLRGDMALVDGRIAPDAEPRLTYANIGVFSPRAFSGLRATRARIFPWLYGYARNGQVSGEHFRGRWSNVGTPGELARLDAELHRQGP